MQPDIAKYLHDVLQACRLLAEFTRNKSFEDYADDPLLRSAVERQLIVVGEALFQASKVDRNLGRRIPDLQSIIDFRHVMVHGYAVVEHSTVWGVLKKDIPELHRVMVRLLK